MEQILFIESPGSIESAVAIQQKVRAVTSLLPELCMPHVEFVLLRSCLALPKIVFLLRTTDTTQYKQELQDFDRITREALSRILGGPIDDKGWGQAKLPVSMGGVGLRAAENHASAAFATFLISSQPMMKELQGAHQEQGGDQEQAGEEEEPPNLPPALLADLSLQMGEEITLESMHGLNQG